MLLSKARVQLLGYASKNPTGLPPASWDSQPSYVYMNNIIVCLHWSWKAPMGSGQLRIHTHTHKYMSGQSSFFPPAQSWLVNSNFPLASRMQGKSYYSSNKHGRLTIQLVQSLYFRPFAVVKWNKHGPQTTAQHSHSSCPLSNILWSNCSAVQRSRIFYIWHDAKATRHHKDHRDITEWSVLAWMLSWRQVSKLQLPYFPSNLRIAQPHQRGKT